MCTRPRWSVASTDVEARDSHAFGREATCDPRFEHIGVDAPWRSDLDLDVAAFGVNGDMTASNQSTAQLESHRPALRVAAAIDRSAGYELREELVDVR